MEPPIAAIPTLTEEDAKRPNRERESLVGEQGRIVNRMKAALARLGIRNFNPKLKKAADHLEDLHTPEGSEPSRPSLAERNGLCGTPLTKQTPYKVGVKRSRLLGHRFDSL